MRRGDQLRLDRGVDAIEAGVVDRRRADADVDLGRGFNESYVLPGDSEIPDADGDDSLPGGR